MSTRAVGPNVVDLNADLGEEVTDDAALLEVVTSANVACGYHAGSTAIMREVCERAAGLGVVVGAQVSYADRPNFGRVPHDVPYDVLREQVAHQAGVLRDVATAAGIEVGYLKPHGALYHRVLDDDDQAHAVLDGSGRLPVLTMPGVFFEQAVLAGREAVLEGFPDRGYDDAGRLLARDQPGALVHDPDEIGVRAVALAGRVGSVCLHGDSPGAVRAAVAVRAALESAGWTLRPFAAHPQAGS